MLDPLRSLGEGGPHGQRHAAAQSRGPPACGGGSGTHAPRGWAHGYRLPSPPCPCPLVWPWRSSPPPGESRRAACSLEGGGTPRGTRDVPLPPAWPDAHRAPGFSAGPEARYVVGRAAPPRVWGARPHRPGGRCPRAPLAPAGYDAAQLVWRLGGGGPPACGAGAPPGRPRGRVKMGGMLSHAGPAASGRAQCGPAPAPGRARWHDQGQDRAPP